MALMLNEGKIHYIQADGGYFVISINPYTFDKSQNDNDT